MAKQKHWSNRFSFIVTTAAFAIGLGNIWRFPYLTGENGGGAFLLVYLLLVFLVGIPILLTEISLGRMAGSSPLTGYGKLGGHKNWNLIGWLGVIGAFMIMGFYVMILSWVLKYLLDSITGAIFLLEPEALPAHFNAVTENTRGVLMGAVGITLLSGFIVFRGLKGGVERLSNFLMPALFVLIVILGGWAITFEGAWEGISWYLKPDFSKINFQVILAALGQLFFSIGVAMAVAFVFGSYNYQEDDVIESTGLAVLADTLVAFLAGFMIFPALFAFKMAPDAGPSLVFITMANLFAEIPQGQLFGALFFFLLLIAGMTTVVGALEGLSYSLSDRFSFSDNRSLMIVILLIIVLAIPNSLSYGTSPLADLGGRSFFDWVDFAVNTVMLPIVALLIILFASYVVGFRNFQNATNHGARRFKVVNFLMPVVKFVIPALLILIFLNGLLGWF